jgi:hypothetical protein
MALSLAVVPLMIVAEFGITAMLVRVTLGIVYVPLPAL